LPVSVVIACEHGLVRHALGSLLKRQPGIEVAAEIGISPKVAAQAQAAKASIVLITVDSADSAV